MHKTKVSTATILLIAVLLVSAVPIIISGSNAATASDSFSIMQISDTQHLAFLSPALYNDTTSWIVNNSAAYNLQMVVHTGDFVDAFGGSPIVAYNDSQKAQEWNVANAAMSKLLNAGIPYCWTAGNHDQTPFANSNGTSMASNYAAFNVTDMRSKSYWVGDTYDAKNTAVKFTYNNFTFMIIDVEYLANSSTVAWMKGLLDKNYGVNTIVATHGYLDINANYDSSSAAVGVWTRSFKAMLDSYPSVFLAICGHNHGWNMTKSGNRPEILFDFQEENNMTGAAATRIYTFNLTNKKVYASTYCIDNKTWLTNALNQFSFDASLTSDWALVTDARPMKAYPDLKESIWQKNATMAPNGQYDKIGLHRLVKTGITPKGVVFLTNCPSWGTGELRISNPSSDNWTKYENYSQAIYWANRGFDVYAIDYRTHFVPRDSELEPDVVHGGLGLGRVGQRHKRGGRKSQSKCLAAASSSSRASARAEMAALNYATKYWKDRLERHNITRRKLLHRGLSDRREEGNETNTYNLTRNDKHHEHVRNWSLRSPR